MGEAFAQSQMVGQLMYSGQQRFSEETVEDW
jgi:hypothetical protein